MDTKPSPKVLHLCAALLGATMVPSAGLAETVEIDLNGVPPIEYMVVEDDQTSLHFWSEGNGLWLEVFRGNGEVAVDPSAQSGALAAIRFNDRIWSWDQNAYLPQIGQLPSYAGALSVEQYERAVRALGGFDAAPAPSPANQGFSVVSEGAVVEGVELAAGPFCSMGGAFCPVVFFTAEGPFVSFVDLAFEWGVSEEGQPFRVESGGPRKLIITDPVSEVREELVAVPPAPSEIELPTP